MTLIPFIIPPGVDSDDTTFKKVARVSSASLVRTRLGSWETIGAWGSPTVSLSEKARNIFSWNQAGSVMLAYGTPTQIKTATGTGTVTSRLASPLSSVLQWSFGAWGDYLLAMPVGSGFTGKLLVWTGSGNASAVSTSPASANVMLPVHTRQVMMLGTNRESGGAFDGLCGRVCDIEDYTDWTTAAGSNAGEFILDGRDPIIAAREVDKTVYALSRSALYRIDYFGSDGWIGNMVAAITGPRNKNEICERLGTIYWVGSNFRWYNYNPATGVQEMACPLTREIDTNTFPTGDLHHMAYLQRQDEIWFCYGDIRDGAGSQLADCSRIIVYSPKESELAGYPVWFTHVLARTAIHDAGPTGLLMCDTSNTVQTHELAFTNLVSGWFLQTGDFYIEERNRRMEFQGFIPDFEYFASTSSTTRITLYLRDYPSTNAASSSGPHAMSSSGEVLTKVDFRASGMIAQAYFDSAAGASWRMGKHQWNMAEPGGER